MGNVFIMAIPSIPCSCSLSCVVPHGRYKFIILNPSDTKIQPGAVFSMVSICFIVRQLLMLTIIGFITTACLDSLLTYLLYVHQSIRGVINLLYQCCRYFQERVILRENLPPDGIYFVLNGTCKF